MKNMKYEGKVGVNALNGLTSFLQNWKSVRRILTAMCQRPKRAYFISTYDERKHYKPHATCVNALNGLTSFLRDGAC